MNPFLKLRRFPPGPTEKNVRRALITVCERFLEGFSFRAQDFGLLHLQEHALFEGLDLARELVEFLRRRRGRQKRCGLQFFWQINRAKYGGRFSWAWPEPALPEVNAAMSTVCVCAPAVSVVLVP